MTDYQPTDADREAAKAICKQFFIVLGNDERTHKLISAIIAEKMQPERESAKENWRAEALLRRYGQLKAVFSRPAGGCGGRNQANILRQWVDRGSEHSTGSCLTPLNAYREATK
jgi:hypothetical protein